MTEPDPTALAPVAPAQRQSDQMLLMIERIATSPTFNLEALNAVVALRERLQASESKSAFDRDLSAMQPQLPTIDAKGRVTIFSKADREKPGGPKPTDVPQQETPYALMADINDAVRPALAEFGFALSFRVGQAADGKITVTGILSHREGHREETTLTLMYDSSGSKNSVQAVGSSLSYGRRYATLLLLNISSRAPQDVDDDERAAGVGATITEEQVETLTARLKSADRTPEKFLEFFSKLKKREIKTMADIPAALLNDAIDAINGVVAAVAKKKAEKLNKDDVAS